ncbi:MAG: hypothetical protein N2043_01695 [Ignavibacterium sp.]|nr:hypothetical protein [Ignavibacterium sp.]
MSSLKDILIQQGYSEQKVQLASDVMRTQYTQHKKRLEYIKIMNDISNNYQKPVYPVGPIQPLVMIVDDMPEEIDITTGMPFTGKKGYLLTMILNHLGIDRNALYLTSTIKTYKQPNEITEEDISFSLETIQKEISSVCPLYIITFGVFSYRIVLQDKTANIQDKIGKMENYQFFSVIPFHSLSLLKEETEKSNQLKKEIFHSLKQTFDTIKQNHPEWVYDYVLSQYKQTN